ncbi:hypothetical protein OEZ71_05660 [Defluviimonas sp. WL0050]|uniref:Uncharacterized protein n=1 Tax=Albidovulum litorale TaxID=2984134 RepID=A0ABT2ZKW8_9RHOB|nr:hypothetical protein [Defluviimonas sp. WL0050]MCV2871776.1 hypothetical protein [Defluviimonas sp. WL0050]
MTLASITRAGAAGLILSGAALGYSYVAHPHHMSAETIASSGWIIIHALFALSLVLGLLGTTALYAPTALMAGELGLTGFVMLFVGMMMIFGLDYYEVLIAPFLAVNYPEVIQDHGAGDAMGPVAIFFPLAGLLTVAGYAMLGIVWLRIGVVPRFVGLALALTAMAFGIGLSPVGGLALARLTAAGFGLALMAVGIHAIRRGWSVTADAQDVLQG